MYQDTDTFPGGGLALLVLLSVSALAPGWAASALGCATLHEHLVSWILAQPVVLLLALGALYIAAGCTLMIGVIFGVGAGGRLHDAGARRLIFWAARTSLGLATALGALLPGRCSSSANSLGRLRAARRPHERLLRRAARNAARLSRGVCRRLPLLSRVPARLSRAAEGHGEGTKRSTRWRRRSACWACRRASPGRISESLPPLIDSSIRTRSDPTDWRRN